MKRVAIIGASGGIGTMLLPEFDQGKYLVIPLSKKDYDMNGINEACEDLLNADVVINLAV
jgi:dTDP-4-dehydrorhamnose reductase